jgi:hypothetical protein
LELDPPALVFLVEVAQDVDRLHDPAQRRQGSGRRASGYRSDSGPAEAGLGQPGRGGGYHGGPGRRVPRGPCSGGPSLHRATRRPRPDSERHPSRTGGRYLGTHIAEADVLARAKLVDGPGLLGLPHVRLTITWLIPG